MTWNINITVPKMIVGVAAIIAAFVVATWTLTDWLHNTFISKGDAEVQLWQEKNRGRLERMEGQYQALTDRWNLVQWQAVLPAEALGKCPPDDPPLQALRDPTGFVHLRGRVCGSKRETTVFMLPAAYRPQQAIQQPIAAKYLPSILSIDAQGHGKVKCLEPCYDSQDRYWWSLDGVVFFGTPDPDVKR